MIMASPDTPTFDITEHRREHADVDGNAKCKEYQIEFFFQRPKRRLPRSQTLRIGKKNQGKYEKCDYHHKNEGPDVE
jgi:hypothetical protein